MATTITVKLNKAANEFQAGESIGFGINAGIQVYNHKTKEKEWTNYKAAIFARQSGQIEFYRSALTEGAIVEITAPHERIDSYEGQNGVSLTIELIDAKLGAVFSGLKSDNNASQSNQSNAQSQAPAFSGADDNGFKDSDIDDVPW